MIKVLLKIPPYWLFRRLGWPRMLPMNLTITPSPRCNARCRTCNIWKKREDELSLDEWEKIFRSLGKTPFWITVSGGEPFLFRDLVELVQLVYQYCHPGIINIPTNALLHERIPRQVDEIARTCPESQIIINLSLDGVGERHDWIRGVPGNFEKFEKAYRALRALGHSNLSIGIHSVISTFNVDDIEGLYDYVFGLQPDQYITEIAEERVELDTVGLNITPSQDKYSRAIDELIERVENQDFKGIARVTEAFRVEYYELVKRILVEKTQIIDCYAGWASAQIYANGEVWPCCVRADNLGSLRDADYDFARIWFSPQTDIVRRSIKNKECHCPLANASYTNMLHHIPTLLRVGTTVIR